MLNQKPIQLTTGVITVASLILLSFSSIGSTQTAPETNDTNQEEESIADSVPDRRKGGASRSSQTPENSQQSEDEEMVQAPQRRKPAARRNDNQCNFNPQEVIALIPENLRGKTTADSPTLYFSVPVITANTEIEFVLRGPEDQLVEKQTFFGQGKAGIMGLKLPKVSRISGLNSQKTYHWYLSVICNQSDRADDIVVEGLLQPITLESNLRQQLQATTIEERIRLYQSHDLWHERLDALATIKRSQPENTQVSQQLGQLLDSVKLDPIIGQQPLLETQMLSSNR
ncbi:MAG: DUF928 domain-containing protein [Crocosphaera sp.]|nr:DUF928 domain-containing protein [Crocosphaera sp.]